MGSFEVRRRGLLAGGALGAVWMAAGRAFGAALGYQRALQGPMIGHTGPNHLTVWARVSGAFDVQVEYGRKRDFSDSKTTPPMRASPETDFTVKVPITGLEPSTDYFYRLRLDGGVTDRFAPLPNRARTAPAGHASFRVAF